mgnify:CR=1 FL=1
MEKKRLILWIAVILTLAFIFGQSLLKQEASVKESNVVKEKIVQPVHEAVTGNVTLPRDIHGFRIRSHSCRCKGRSGGLFHESG